MARWRIVTAVVLVVVAVWLGAAVAALLTGAATLRAIGPAAVVGLLAIGVAALLGATRARRRDTTYW